MAHLWCSSFSRAVGGTDSNFTLVNNSAQGMGSPAQNGRFERVRLVDATICNSVWNVTADNCTLSVLEQTGNHLVVATVAVGNYTVAALTAAVAAALTADSAVNGNGYAYTCVVSGLTSKATIGTAGAGNFIVLAAPVGAPLNALNQLLGFSKTQNSPAQAVTQTGPRVANMARVPFAFLHCSLVRASSSWNALYSQQGAQSGQLSDIIAAIPLATVPYGEIVSWMPPTNEWHQIADPTLGNLSFSLRDETGAELDLNGSYWSVHLEVQ